MAKMGFKKYIFSAVIFLHRAEIISFYHEINHTCIKLIYLHHQKKGSKVNFRKYYSI